jgi:hypothetical protein
MAEEHRPVAPVDPTNLRPMLFLDVAHEMMLDQDWPYRAVSAVMESHTGPGRFAFYGANHPDSIEDVHARRVDISILNPAALLTMAHRGTGALDSPREVATIAVLPHDDQLGFAVTDRLRFTSLEDIAAARYPLRVSVRGSIDACTPIMVDVVLRAHGLCLDDIRATVDFSGWPIYCRSDTPDALVEKVLPGPGQPTRRHRVGHRGCPPTAPAARAHGERITGHPPRCPDAPARCRLATAWLPPLKPLQAVKPAHRSRPLRAPP